MLNLKKHDLDNLEEKNEGVDNLSSEERRHFMKMGLAVTGVFAGGTLLSAVSNVKTAYASASEFAEQYPYKPHYSMLIKVSKCIDCERCKAACAKTNDVPDYGYRTDILQRNMPQSVDQKREFIPVLCNHCNIPQCTRVCPTKATYKDKNNGIVMMNPSKCIGCLTCQMGCPYNARYFNEEKMAVDKCSFCWETRLSQGKASTACATACPTGARTFGDISDPRDTVYRQVHQLEKAVWVLRKEAATKPNVFYMKG
ncbi:MAG: twin-arginine translocation pathway signal protein [Desulfuromonas sp.]|nr:MAG: twin-arginine translocation pathway signal protein [Desulfuromonas sp.]